MLYIYHFVANRSISKRSCDLCNELIFIQHFYIMTANIHRIFYTPDFDIFCNFSQQLTNLETTLLLIGRYSYYRVHNLKFRFCISVSEDRTLQRTYQTNLHFLLEEIRCTAFPEVTHPNSNNGQDTETKYQLTELRIVRRLSIILTEIFLGFL
jgi:hypothetical protein